jgi:hypothetical protein
LIQKKTGSLTWAEAGNNRPFFWTKSITFPALAEARTFG